MTTPPNPALVSHVVTTARHTTHYWQCGPDDGPLMIFLHGWPGIGLLWRAQLQAFAADGWRCVAPDMRGYGRSSTPSSSDDYAMSHIVADMIELHDQLGGAAAIWVGHDWGSVAVGAVAAHEPDRCRGVVFTSWAYFPESTSLHTLVPLIDRSIYPVERYPDGQWDYYRYYATHFDAAVSDLDADPYATLAGIFRSGDPAAVRTVAPSATVSRTGGRFGAAHRAPRVDPDRSLWPPHDFDALVEAFEHTGFGPSCAWYTNDDANIAYAHGAYDNGRLSMPVLYIVGAWDAICTIEGNRQGEPMSRACADLTVARVHAGHWLPLERRSEHIEAVNTWLRATKLGLAR